VRIVFRKISDETHVLEISDGEGRHEHVECETRSYLVHDLLHFAVESEARLKAGFWGSLERGRTLAEMNDRRGGPMEVKLPEMAMIELLVGALHGVAKGRTPKEMVDAVIGYSALLGSPVPKWLTEDFVAAIQERMRRLAGHWKATPYGGTMELDWPP